MSAASELSVPGDRVAGVLVHPSSLPGRFGIGDLGPGAIAFLDWAQAAGMRLWQVLPLCPIGLGDSPYAARSAFAGEPLLVSPDRLLEEGWLDRGDAEGAPAGSGNVDYDAVRAYKERVLRRAWERFPTRASADARAALDAFASDPRQADWLEEWALFAAIREEAGGRPWLEWDRGLARREPEALEAARRRLDAERAFHRFCQFLFFRQWRQLRAAAAARGIALMGDLPIYLAQDSAEVWSRRELFELDEEGRPEWVAGVPPDFFSRTGQRWGNPLYRWDRLRETGYAWWIGRLRANLELADRVRIDHFRAFAGYWAIPAGEPTAVAGEWRRGPGVELFAAVAAALGRPAIVAEDLGTITDDVRALLAETGFPGMKVLQFAFAEPDSAFLPHRHVRNGVVYTGTHDNDTTRGWFAALADEERQRVVDYLGAREETIARDLIRAAFASVADTAIVPLQDVLELGSEARMNTPGLADGNWSWRVPPGALDAGSAAWLRRLVELTARA